jgi:hypothetical protein
VVASEATHCAACSSEIADDGLLLWDGKLYCRDCVERASPELAELAAQDVTLSETFVASDLGPMTWLRGILFGFIPGSMIAGMAFLWWEVPFFVTLLSATFVMATVIVAARRYYERSALPRTVSVRNGVLWLTSPRQNQNWPLATCRWWVGGPHGDSLITLSRARRTIVFTTPDCYVACGYTSESRQLWRAFLELARIPRDTLRHWLSVSLTPQRD